ncbi:MAG: LuxR C-terminal-related transcriptional regulator [Desulfopila sp.]
MNLILCCSDASLQDRWFSVVNTLFTTYRSTTLADLRILVKQRIAFDLLLLHAAQVDQDSVRYIRERRPACRLFILSDRPEDEEGLGYLRLGVVGYGNSYISPDRLRAAVLTLAEGGVWINQRLMRRLITAPAVQPSLPAGNADSEEGQTALTRLSNREYQISHLVADGLPNLAIAERLGITERTVKAHLGAIYAKTSTRGRLGLALLVKQGGAAKPLRQNAESLE